MQVMRKGNATMSEYNYFSYSLLLCKFSRHCEVLGWSTTSSLSRGAEFLVFV